MSMDYREILSDCFQQRRKANPRYSLRAFARDISLSPSRLCEVIGGKGELSREKGSVIAKQLRLSPLKAADFLDMIDAVTAPLSSDRKAAIGRLQKRKPNSNRKLFDAENFKIIGNPMYVLIWTYMMLPVFDGTAESIAKHLKLNVLEVFEALRRLESAELVARQGGSWRVIASQFTSGDDKPSESIREYHRRMAELGRKSIDSQSMSTRHLDSAVIPFDSARLGEVQQRIAEFTQSLIDDYGCTGDSVYGLSLQFFRMVGPIRIQLS